MGTFILATVGTSLLNHLKRELAIDSLPARQAALSLLRKSNPTDTICGAEINSIEHLLSGTRLSAGETGPPFELAFLVSETEDGRWTGELLVAYYCSVRGIEHVTWSVIQGLSPEDPYKFARVGLRSLVRESSSLLRDAAQKGLFRVINATGGFKAQISFAGLIGQTLGVPVVYQFETFPTCVEMPPMPVDFDREIWLVHYDLFAKLSEAGAMLESAFPFDELDPVIRDLLDFVEERGQRLYALSPILELMHQGFLVRRPRKIVEPPDSAKRPEQKLCLVPSELSHAPKGTENLAHRLAASFRWITRVTQTRFMNTARSHLLERTPDITLQRICYSDGQLGVEFHVYTTCEHEGHVEYVREKLAEYLHRK